MSTPYAPGSALSAAPRRPLDVLIVDDDEPSRTALCSAVRALGHNGRAVGSGSEALSIHRRHRADVIISDWAMPGMDGIELCRRVRAVDGGTYTYLLFTSARATKRDFVDAARAGADDSLSKPVDLDELEARLIAAERVVHAYRSLAERNAGLRHDSHASFLAARIDPLTRVANRLRLDEDRAAFDADAARYRRRLVVAMCDLDAFKHWNDHHGHVAGDEALRRVAGAIQGGVRRADHVYRYGGEEFLVVLPEQTPENAFGAMQRVRADVEALGLAHAPGTVHPVLTVSVGVAAVVPGGVSPLDDAIRRADRALYRAKDAGGNRVEVEPAD